MSDREAQAPASVDAALDWLRKNFAPEAAAGTSRRLRARAERVRGVQAQLEIGLGSGELSLALKLRRLFRGEPQEPRERSRPA